MARGGRAGHGRALVRGAPIPCRPAPRAHRCLFSPDTASGSPPSRPPRASVAGPPAGAGDDRPGRCPGAHAHPGQRRRVRPARGRPGRQQRPRALAIDANPATAWHTDWYATARFGNLYPGTGLLVDMGRPAAITAARITLGQARGAGLQLRVGAAPTLADLPPVAHQANASGVVRFRLTTPAHGRYVLVWFTRLPPDPAGTFQAHVYNLRLEGQP